MKATVAVISDSHGNFDAMYRLLQLIPAPDALLYLGDGYNDFEDLQAVFPQIPMVGVPGNCDPDCMEKTVKTFEIAGKRIFLTHGNEHYVKVTMGPLCKAAIAENAQIALYGHSHIPVVFREPTGLLIMNPGAVKHGCYGLLTIDGDNIDAALCELPKK